MQALLTRTHAMLEEEMHRLLHGLAQSDANAFFGSFLPGLVASSPQGPQLVAAWTPDADLGAFTRHARAFLDDVRAGAG